MYIYTFAFTSISVCIPLFRKLGARFRGRGLSSLSLYINNFYSYVYMCVYVFTRISIYISVNMPPPGILRHLGARPFGRGDQRPYARFARRV